MSDAWKRWQDWVTVLIGVLLFISPFVFVGNANQFVAWTAFVGGVLLVIAGLWSLASPVNQFSEWAEVVIGILVFITPWVLGFSGLTAMAWSAWIAGILAVVLGGSVVLNERGRHELVSQR